MHYVSLLAIGVGLKCIRSLMIFLSRLFIRSNRLILFLLRVKFRIMNQTKERTEAIKEMLWRTHRMTPHKTVHGRNRP